VSEGSIAEITKKLTAPGEALEIETRVIRGVPTRVWKHIPQTVPALIAYCRRFDEREYLVYEDERLTYAETFARVAKLADHLQRVCGVRKGDRVSLAMRNFPEWPIAFWACLCSGAIVVPLNAWWKAGELAYGVSDSGSRVLICDAERAQLMASQLASLPLEHVLVARAEAELPSSLRRLEDVFAAPACALPSQPIDPEDDATIFYTSGTTGQPKGALGTHRNLCTSIGSTAFARARTAARLGRPSLPPPVQAVALVSVPLFHVTGSHSSLTAGTSNGNKLVMMRKWNPERALELIERERITQFGGVPSMVWQVLESPDFPRRDTSSVVGVGYGGAPAASDLVRRIKAAFPLSSASNGYGLTETSALAISNAGVDYERKPDSIGVPVAVCEAKIVGTDGEVLPAGAVGELIVNGPNVVKGYWRKPEASAASFRDGWLYSGDIARIDEEGFVFVLDRAKDMLIRGGENVYCVEVEDVLYSHPAVIDAAVIGIPHRVLGEEVGAIVQLIAEASVTGDDLRAYAAERLAGFKVPIRIELRREPLPRNANGKIMKRDLKRELGWS
jgi:long-chain acyl-CoA synthetase